MATLYVALPDRLLTCNGDPDGGQWTTETRLKGRRLECVAVAPTSPNRAFAGTFESGLFRTTDGGTTFDRLETPFESDAVTAATITPHDPETVYVGTEPSRVYRSADGGDSWTHLEGIADLPSEPEWYFPPRPHTHHVRWLSVDPFDPDRLYVGIEAGAFLLSTDGGESWIERPAGARRDNHSLATHPDRDGLVYAAAGDGFAVSTDGGERWDHPQDGLEHRYCWSVVPDPGDPETVIVSSASGASTAHTPESAESYVYRRRGDEDWHRLEDRGLPTGEGVVRAVFDTTGSDGEIYAVTNEGVFRSTDFGDAWSRVPIDRPEVFVEKTPRGLVALE
ncbi:WD40/YVTN/BNR-like repeat-containing protein [Natrarchaeobius chitinivorans]|uniref:Glycosyl hydrolase n=1 Tax=Natrarchaeobius chitinivorans TaxID=1679083 RepID=A0A3N6M6S8_NATCH|nr:hypothetical protein [Natrarchaeobius chitinivorans]RQG91021.1 hypothetical protein EA473_18925 [Natrarchaeobius chitinivorans]